MFVGMEEALLGTKRRIKWVVKIDWTSTTSNCVTTYGRPAVGSKFASVTRLQKK